VQPINWSPLGFEPQTKKPSQWFWGSNHHTRATGFEANLTKTVATGFEAKPVKTVAAGFEAKPLETVAMILMPKSPNQSCQFWGQTGENRHH
jgi:hypothetical protein